MKLFKIFVLLCLLAACGDDSTNGVKNLGNDSIIGADNGSNEGGGDDAGSGAGGGVGGTPREVERVFPVLYAWDLREDHFDSNTSNDQLNCANFSREELIHMAERLNDGLQDYLTNTLNDSPVDETAAEITEYDCHRKGTYRDEGILNTHGKDDVVPYKIESIVTCVGRDGVSADKNGPYFGIKSYCALLKK